MKENFLNSGLQKDTTFHREGTVEYALNCIVDSHDGGKIEYKSEPGNEYVTSLTQNYKPIGIINGPDNKVYIFSTNGTRSEIGYFQNNRYTVLVNAVLGFSDLYPITGEHRLRNGCNNVIYWCDGVSDDMYFIEEKPEDFKRNGQFVKDLFFISKRCSYPVINLVKVNTTGGSISIGTYFFQIELLDRNKNKIVKTDITAPVPIFHESDKPVGKGSLPETYDPLIGGRGKTSRSIDLLFNNIDPSCVSFVKINVAYKTAGTGVTEAATKTIEVFGTNVNWTFTGINSSWESIAYAEMLIPINRYKSSYVMEQVNNRLVRANMRRDIYDFAPFQTYATKIKTEWITKSEAYDSDDPRTYWFNRTFQSDETYAVGIQYLMDNNTWSPVFHIPGRPSETSDIQNVPIGIDTDPEIYGLQPSDVIANYKINQTYSVDHTYASGPLLQRGKMNYHQCDSGLYSPNITWGNDYLNRPISGTPIRHHRLPDRNVIGTIEGNLFGISFGMRFTDVTYPPFVKGHRFVMGDREYDRTVLDTGYAARTSSDTNIPQNRYNQPSSFNNIFGTLSYYNCFPINNTTPPTLSVSYTSSQIRHKITSHPNAFLKRTRNYSFQRNPDLSRSYRLGNVDSVTSTSNQDYVNDLNVMRPSVLPLLSATEYQPIGTAFVEPMERHTDSVVGNVYNAGCENYNVLRLQREFSNFTSNTQNNLDLYYTYKKQIRDVFNDLEMIKYVLMEHNPSGEIVFGGDTILIKDISTAYAPYRLPTLIFNFVLYEEQQINPALKVSGLYENAVGLYTNVEEWFERRTGKRDSSGTLIEYTEKVYEYKRLNPDLNYSNIGSNYYTLPVTWDPLCDGLYPTRIIFSPRSFDEELQDFYFTMNTNDYIDLPGHRGPITGIKYVNNRLLVHCEDATFILSPNPQFMKSQGAEVYLQSGDFFSIPAQEMLETDTGYAGCLSKQAQILTPFGWYWIDEKRGEIFEYNGQMKKISDIGFQQYFLENAKSKIEEKIRNFYNYGFTSRSTYHKFGVGFNLSYDPRFKRVIIHRHDYDSDQPFAPFDTNDDGLVFTGSNWIRRVNGQSFNNVNFDEFINKSETISYYPWKQQWISWHSYIPRSSFSDNAYMYTFNVGDIYRHSHKNNFQTFYEVKRDMVIDLQYFDINTKELNAVFYMGFARRWDSLNETWIHENKTFDRLWVYTDKHSTGLRTVVLQDQIANPYQNIKPNGILYAVNTHGNHKISGLYNVAGNPPFSTTEWSFMESDYPIDKVPVPTLIVNPAPYQQGVIRDKAINIRFYFKPSTDTQKVIILSTLNTTNTVR